MFHEVYTGQSFFCQLLWQENLAVFLILVVQRASVHAWLGRALCRRGVWQLWSGNSSPTARRRLLLHVHRLPSLHLPVAAHILAIHLLGGCSAIKVSGWTVNQVNQIQAKSVLGLCWTGRMFRDDFLGGWPFSLGADLHLLVKITQLSIHDQSWSF